MKVKLLSLVIALAFLPFSLYLTYLMLMKVGASDLMWFLYWMLIPVSFISAILQRLAEWEEK